MSARRPTTAPVDDGLGVELIALTATSCRWPLGDTAIRYCGADTGGVLESYCAAHRRLAYARPPSRGVPKDVVEGGAGRATAGRTRG